MLLLKFSSLKIMILASHFKILRILQDGTIPGIKVVSKVISLGLKELLEINHVCAELGSISPHNKLKVISFEIMPCNPNKRL